MTAHPVLRLADVDVDAVGELLSRFGMALKRVPDGRPVPGSWWGDSEAGLRGSQLLARSDTPVHSVLHEACHFICMDPARRSALDTDAGGDYDEENGVCYLQVVLSDHVPGMGRARMFEDMDAWGYSFRLGSAAAWFGGDAEDARAWLQACGILDAEGRPTWRCRGEAPVAAA